MKYILILVLLVNLIYSQNLEQIVKHNYYTVSYNEQHEQANWVRYELTPRMLVKNVSRVNYFKVDNEVTTETAKNSDYYKSGYNKGHLVPVDDMLFSELAMKETFYLSNVAPQDESFNKGIWKVLENRVRDYVEAGNEVVVITGSIFINSLGTIGDNEVTIPSSFYKIIYDERNNIMFSYIIPNKKCNTLSLYISNVDSIESITNIDFFNELENEKELEQLKRSIE